MGMKKFLVATLSFLLASCTACTGCGAVAPAPAANPRASTRAAVDVAKDAWVLVAHGCIDTAEALNDDNIRMQCAKYLTPAHGLIQAAAGAVDANWNAGAACDLVNAAVMLNSALSNVQLGNGIAADVLPVVEDAMKLAKDLSGECRVSDGGLE